MPAASRGLAISIFVVGVASALSCGREVTGPAGGIRLSQAISIQPMFRAVPWQAELSSGVDFSRLRLTLKQLDGSLALERVADFPASSDTLRLSVAVPLSPSAPSAGERMIVRLELITSAGDTVFRGGPDTLFMERARAGIPPAEVAVNLVYTGPGAQATRLELTRTTFDTVSGSALTFSAQAFDAQNALVPNAPVLFTSSDTALLRFANARSGAATTLIRRGSAFAIASLLTGPADSAGVSLALPASTIAAASGSGQSALAGTVLPAPVIVVVRASDGVAASGVAVMFAAASGGLVADASVVSDVNGLASTTWTLGTSSGVQNLSATATGLTGSPLVFTATSLAGVATQLAFVTQPSTTAAGSSLGSVIVQARDVSGNLDATFVGAVTIGIGTNPGGAVLSGPTTANAVGGVATFTGLSVNVPATGYTLAATASGLTGTTSAPFSAALILMDRTTNDGSFESNTVFDINFSPTTLPPVWTITSIGPNIGGLLSNPPHTGVLAGADGTNALFADGPTPNVTTATSANLLGGAYPAVAAGDVFTWSFMLNSWTTNGTGTLRLNFGSGDVTVSTVNVGDTDLTTFQIISGTYIATAANAAGGQLSVRLSVGTNYGVYGDNVRLSVWRP